MQAIPGLTLARHDGPFGNALLTRRKVLDVRRLGFTYSRREPRNALDVDLEVNGETGASSSRISACGRRSAATR